MNFPKISAIDIDGTLVTPDKTITSRNADGIRDYLRHGGIVLLASGRMHSSIRPYADRLQLTGDSIILSYNGAMAMSVDGELLFDRPVPAAYGAMIIAFCKENGLHLNFYYNDTLFVSKLDHWSELYFQRTGSESVPVGDLTELAEKSPTKLLIIDEKARLDSIEEMFKIRFRNKLYVTKTDDEYLEFMADGVDKGSGLAWVCEKLNIAQPDSAAFGDSFNDVQMIEWAGIGVAMSNGREAARKAADVVADNDAWTGVGDTLVEFVSTK